MFVVTCSSCGKAKLTPKEAFRVGEAVLCDTCLQTQPPTADTRVVRLDDPSTCMLCARKSTNSPFKVYDGTPICGTCIDKDLSKPFPLWVKAFFAGILVLVIFSIVWNWRFFTAYRALQHINAGLEKGDLVDVVSSSAEAAEALPENSEINAARAYFRGIQLLAADSCSKALASFDEAQDLAPGQFGDMDRYRHAARSGAAFEAHDYPQFLQLSKEDRDAAPDSAYLIGGVASAYACRFVETGDSVYRDSSLSELDRARRLSQGDTAFLDYEQRIRYRLFARQIITSQVFHERFPNGWHQ